MKKKNFVLMNVIGFSLIFMNSASFAVGHARKKANGVAEFAKIMPYPLIDLTAQYLDFESLNTLRPGSPLIASVTQSQHARGLIQKLLSPWQQIKPRWQCAPLQKKSGYVTE